MHQPAVCPHLVSCCNICVVNLPFLILNVKMWGKSHPVNCLEMNMPVLAPDWRWFKQPMKRHMCLIMWNSSLKEIEGLLWWIFPNPFSVCRILCWQVYYFIRPVVPFRHPLSLALRLALRLAVWCRSQSHMSTGKSRMTPQWFIAGWRPNGLLQGDMKRQNNHLH